MIGTTLGHYQIREKLKDEPQPNYVGRSFLHFQITEKVGEGDSDLMLVENLG